MDLRKVISAEMQNADQLLLSLVGEDVDTISVQSIEAEDAPFLGLVVSKLSPMIGNLLERRIIQLLDRDSKHGMHWVRQDPGFPDALLVDHEGRSTEAGYEVKAWYALSTELTGRFKESQNLLAPRNVRVVIIAWAMSHIVYGKPRILGVLTVDGSSVAASRDLHYHKPPGYLIVEPGDTTSRTRNLQQTNVNGFKWQGTSAKELQAATQLVSKHPGKNAPPHSPKAQALCQELMAKFSYRNDTNFAKVDRIDNAEIEAFKSKILAMELRSRPVKKWASLLKALNGEGDQRDKAAEIIQAIYDEL